MPGRGWRALESTIISTGTSESLCDRGVENQEQRSGDEKGHGKAMHRDGRSGDVV